MPNYSGPEMVTTGLILSLNAADKNSYPGSGTTWYNLANSALNGSLINGVSFSTSNGGVMSLDGTDDLILAPSVNSLGSLSDQTFEIWVKSPGLGTGMSIGGLICPDYGMISYIAGDGNIVYYGYNTDTNPFGYVFSIGTSGVNLFDNNWHYVVCTRQNYGTARIYVDGVLKVTSGNTGNWSGITIWSGMSTSIGSNPNDAPYKLLGNIALANIYNTSFTLEQVLQNYNATRTRFGI